jgi:hypothetical protein
MTFNKYWFYFFIIKLMYMFFSILLLSKFVVLAENLAWLSGGIRFSGLDVFTDSTKMLDFFGGLSYFLMGGILGNLPFMLIAFYGIYYSISKLNLSNKELVIILSLLSFPSFGIWSSIAGKEAVVVFSLGIILGYVIDAINQRRYKISLIEFVAFYLLFVFKMQYYFPIGSLIIYIHMSNILKLKPKGKLVLFILYIVSASLMLFLLRDVINELSFIIPMHFSLGASTRENTIFLDDYDVFYNAGYGMFIGFFGPTLSELSGSPMKILVFIESVFLIIIFLYIAFYGFLNSLRVGTVKVNVYLLSLLIITIFGFLFVHYPVAILNSGSAIRYRTNFYEFLIVFIYFIHLKNKFLVSLK